MAGMSNYISSCLHTTKHGKKHSTPSHRPRSRPFTQTRATPKNMTTKTAQHRDPDQVRPRSFYRRANGLTEQPAHPPICRTPASKPTFLLATSPLPFPISQPTRDLHTAYASLSKTTQPASRAPPSKHTQSPARAQQNPTPLCTDTGQANYRARHEQKSTVYIWVVQQATQRKPASQLDRLDYDPDARALEKERRKKAR